MNKTIKGLLALGLEALAVVLGIILIRAAWESGMPDEPMYKLVAVLGAIASLAGSGLGITCALKHKSKVLGRITTILGLVVTLFYLLMLIGAFT